MRNAHGARKNSCALPVGQNNTSKRKLLNVFCTTLPTLKFPQISQNRMIQRGLSEDPPEPNQWCGAHASWWCFLLLHTARRHSCFPMTVTEAQEVFAQIYFNRLLQVLPLDHCLFFFQRDSNENWQVFAIYEYVTLEMSIVHINNVGGMSAMKPALQQERQDGEEKQVLGQHCLVRPSQIRNFAGRNAAHIFLIQFQLLSQRTLVVMPLNQSSNWFCVSSKVKTFPGHVCISLHDPPLCSETCSTTGTDEAFHLCVTAPRSCQQGSFAEMLRLTWNTGSGLIWIFAISETQICTRRMEKGKSGASDTSSDWKSIPDRSAFTTQLLTQLRKRKKTKKSVTDSQP